MAGLADHVESRWGPPTRTYDDDGRYFRWWDWANVLVREDAPVGSMGRWFHCLDILIDDDELGVCGHHWPNVAATFDAMIAAGMLPETNG